MRLRRERLGWSQEQLGAAAGVSKNTVTSIEKERGYHMSSLTQVLTALDNAERDAGLQVGDVPMFRAGSRQPPSLEADPIDLDVSQYEPEDIPVIQEGDASPNGFVYDGDPIQTNQAPRTSRPYDYREKGAYAVVLRGDSMEPTLKRGMRLIVSQIQKVLDGDLVYVQLKSGERLAKIATRQADGWLLVSANPAYGPRFVKFDEVAHIHKVAYVRLLK
ncbi:MAG: S24 family peptidase [Vicinamibacterales bacterium]